MAGYFAGSGQMLGRRLRHLHVQPAHVDRPDGLGCIQPQVRPGLRPIRASGRACCRRRNRPRAASTKVSPISAPVSSAGARGHRRIGVPIVAPDASATPAFIRPRAGNTLWSWPPWRSGRSRRDRLSAVMSSSTSLSAASREGLRRVQGQRPLHLALDLPGDGLGHCAGRRGCRAAPGWSCWRWWCRLADFIDKYKEFRIRFRVGPPHLEQPVRPRVGASPRTLPAPRDGLGRARGRAGSGPRWRPAGGRELLSRAHGPLLDRGRGAAARGRARSCSPTMSGAPTPCTCWPRPCRPASPSRRLPTGCRPA